MRIVNLDLDRYGPFTGKHLVFRPDAKLHIVFGRNEAGKSCSLAAVTDLLFGIERSTRFDFIHPGKDLRVGACIRDSKGAELSFRRRKNKPALTDISDRALPDDALAPFLGGLSRDVFRRAFGLDAEALRKSSDELKQSDGELGAALFSAASGLRGFSDVKTVLEAEALKLFAKTKSKDRLFYQASDRYEKARKDLRDSETRAGALKALRDDQAAQLRQIETIRERRAIISGEQARLARLRRAAPVVRAIDEDAARIAALRALPSAHEGLGDSLVAALDKAAKAFRAQDEADKRAEKLAAELDAIAVDPALLERAGNIEVLQRQSGEYLKALRDLPGVEREEDTVIRSLDALAARLGLADLPALLASQPDDASRAHVAECITRGKRLQITLSTRSTERDRENETLAAKKQERDRRGPLRDPRPFRERLAALGTTLKLVEKVTAQDADITVESARIVEAAARLTPSVRDLDALAQAKLPSRGTMATVATRLAEADQKIAREEQNRRAARAEISRLVTALADLAAGGAVPTAERIAAIRAERDAHWSLLSASLFQKAAALDASALAQSVSGFEIAKSEADRLADAAANDAQRVASHADATRRLAEQEKLSNAIEARLASLTGAKDGALEEWRSLWPENLTPLLPTEMAAWLVQIEAVLERREKLQRLRSEVVSAKGSIEAARPAFDALVADLGLASMPGLSSGALQQRIEAEITRAAEIWDAARASDAILGDLESRLQSAIAAAGEAERAMTGWQETFRAALPRIGLPETATETEAEAVLAAWKDVPATASQHETLRRRIDGMKRDAGAFERGVAALAAKAAPDLAEGNPDAHLRAIVQRLTQAREAQARRTELARRIDEARSLAREAVDAKAAADRDVTLLAHKAGLAADSDLEDLARNLSTRDAIEAGLRKRREELANAADGRDEASLREALSLYDPDSAETDLARLKEEDRTLDRSGQEAFAGAREAAQRLDAREGSVDAEVAIQQRRNAEAEMSEAARDWVVLSLAAGMIGTAITRQRLGAQEPMMARAGELFALLTGGAFTALGQSYDEVPVLTACRSDGRDVEVTNMSEGTRDQLYLALRLAYVEDYASRAEPPPLIGDDLFSSFDDARTANGLRALAAIGDRIQPILFTHHSFVVDIARQELGSSVDIVLI